ncbi:MAG: hypothetical protein ACT4P6_20505, partial [Gemmatimonadaceae bacterium]
MSHTVRALPIESLSVAALARDDASPLRRASAILHRMLNAIVALAVAGQFYTIGLVMFGVTGLAGHRVLG